MAAPTRARTAMQQRTGILRTRRWRSSASAAILAFVAAACGASGDHAGAGGGEATGAGTTSGSASGGANGQGGFVASGGSGSGGIDACAGEKHVGNLTPVDVVIMLDQSSSMSAPVGTTTVWSLVRGAINDFVTAPASEGLGVGLQYFPIPAESCKACALCYSPDLQVTDTSTGQCCCAHPTTASCATADGTACPTGGICFMGGCYSGGTNATCDSAVYQALDVPIDMLPMNATPVVTSLAAHSPFGMTPTGPAIVGALAAATARANAYPGHVVAVVLATDGVPSECSPQDITQLSAIVSAAASGTPKVLTFVIGIGDVTALEALAKAGGTTKAYLVSTTGNAGTEFQDALNAIHGSLLACEFDIPQPDSGTLDFGLVNVEFTPSGKPSQIIPQVSSAAACTSAGGWYYDNPMNPKKIVLCDATCTQVKSFNDATIEIVLGCATIVK